MHQVGKFWVCGECGVTCRPGSPAPPLFAHPDLSLLPYPVALTVHRLVEARSSRRDAIRTHVRLKDCFETCLRYLGNVLLAEYLVSSHRSRERDERLLSRLIRPSLGDWLNEVARELGKLLWEDERPVARAYAGLFFEPDARSGKPRERQQLLAACDRLITMRNDTIGHGPEQVDEAYERLFQEHSPAVRELLQGVANLGSYRLCLVTDIDRCETWMGPSPKASTEPGSFAQSQVGHFVLCPPSLKSTVLDLYPFICYLPDREAQCKRLHYYDQIYRYKALKKQAKVIEYDRGDRHEREEPAQGLEAAFTAQLLAEAFGQHRVRMEVIEGRVFSFAELIESHADIVGREFAVERVRQFLQERDRGLLVIQGEPGKGKTALVAHLVENVFDDRMPPAVHFFYRRTAGITSPDVCVRSLYATLLKSYAVLMRQKEVRDTGPGDQADDPDRDFNMLHNLLHQHIGPRLGPASPLLIFIDGMDEAGTTPSGRTAWQRLPDLLPPHVYLIVTTRPTSAASAALARRADAAARLDLDDPGFEEQNFQDGRKYVHRELLGTGLSCETLDAMARVGAGNFLVLKLMCRHAREYLRAEQVEGFLRSLAGTDRQEQLGFIYSEFWRTMLEGCSRDDGDLLCRVAGLLSQARTAVPAELVCDLLDLRAIDWEFALARLRPFLTAIHQDRDGVQETVYRMYHESFADFLRARLAADAPRLGMRWADYCAGWSQLPDGFGRAYALKFAPYYLAETAQWDSLTAILTDPAFLRAKIDAGWLTELISDLNFYIEHADRSSKHASRSLAIDLRDTLANWHLAIEHGRTTMGISADQWLAQLSPLRAPRLGKVVSQKETTETTPTVLLAPPGGYRHPNAECFELNGAACAVRDGETERIAIAATRGRLLVFASHEGAFRFERLQSFETGFICKLETVKGSHVLVMTCGPRGKDNHRRLWLVDLASPLPATEIDIPAETEDFTVLHASDGQAVVVLAVVRDGCSEMRSCRLHFGRGLAAACPIQLVGDGGVVQTVYQVKQLCSFAPNTWGAFGMVGGDWQGECVVTIHRHSQDGIADVTDPAVAEVIRDFWITGVCPLPDKRLAVVRFPKTPDGEGAALLVLTQEGKVELQVPITPTPQSRVGAMLGSEVASGSGYKPLGWHRDLHLLLGHSQSTYHCLTLQSEALPRPLPAAVEQQILYSDDAGTTLYGACPLEGGRVLLVFRGFAAVLGPGPSDISRVVSESAGSTCLLGTTPEGSIAACDERYRDDHGSPVRRKSNHRYLHPHGAEASETPAEEGFLNIGPEGISLSLLQDGVRLIATRGGHHPVVVYDALLDRGIPAHSTRRRVLDALAQDERNWAATVIACQADEASNRADLRIVGQVNGEPMGLLIPDVDGNDPHDGFGLHIRTICGTVLGIERVATERVIRELRMFDLVLFDLPIEQDASDACTSYTGRRLDRREDHFYHPLIRVSESWTLVLGYELAGTVPDTDEAVPPIRELQGALPYTEEAVFTVSQYRIGSLELPSPIEGLTLGGRAFVLERLPGRAVILDLRRVGARTQAQVRQLGVDSEGVHLSTQHQPTDLGCSVRDVVHLDKRHIAVSYDSAPFRVEIHRLYPAPDEEMPVPIGVGYLLEPPKQLTVSCGAFGIYLVVATESAVTWFDLSGFRRA